jgi:hypothetical protein
MTYPEALNIKTDFTMAMEFADYGGRSRADALSKPAKKYSKEELAEALLILQKELDKEKEVLKAIFVLAIKSKDNTEEA